MSRFKGAGYKLVDLNEVNIEEYDLFCARTKKNSEGYIRKKDWVRQQFAHGLRYRLLLIEEEGKLRYKGFIEYVPGEFAWRGVKAKNYMVIHCLWVKGLQGKYAGSGFDSLLVKTCIDDAKKLDMDGVAVVTDKTTWLPNPKLFRDLGFEKADCYPPHFDLYVKKSRKSAPNPRFNSGFEVSWRRYPDGLTILESDQCPHATNMNKKLENYAENSNLRVRKIRIESCEMAQEKVHACGSMCYLINGDVLSHIPINVPKLLARAVTS